MSYRAGPERGYRPSARRKPVATSVNVAAPDHRASLPTAWAWAAARSAASNESTPSYTASSAQ